jgi:hypothetical protein
VSQLHVPPGLQHALDKQLPALAGGSSSGSSTAAEPPYEWDDVWAAIRGVWASQWNARAVAALGKAGLPLQHLRMGVLLQPLLPARYSFVVHTINPSSGSADEVVVQLVVGLGEVLVGNHPGRALGGVIKRAALLAALQQQQAAAGSKGGSVSSVPLPSEAELLAAVDVVSYPSKDAAVVPLGLNLPCCAGAATGSGSGGGGASTRGGWARGGGSAAAVFMARSDSNAEDLPG